MLRPGAVERRLFEPGATEIDVHAVHQHYVHGLRERGATIRTRARVVGAEQRGDRWLVRTGDEEYLTPVVIDAAGAWADRIAALFGVDPVGLRPLRRSAFVADAPPSLAAPMIADIDDRYYLKPEVGRVLCSPSEETPHDPADVRPDEVEIARAIEAINEVTTLDIRHVRAQWGGLRSFVADGRPVVGYGAPGFFWFAGQGGYGIRWRPPSPHRRRPGARRVAAGRRRRSRADGCRARARAPRDQLGILVGNRPICLVDHGSGRPQRRRTFLSGGGRPARARRSGRAPRPRRTSSGESSRRFTSADPTITPSANSAISRPARRSDTPSPTPTGEVGAARAPARTEVAAASPTEVRAPVTPMTALA